MSMSCSNNDNICSSSLVLQATAATGGAGGVEILPRQCHNCI